MVDVGSEIAGMLRSFRAAGVRDRITGADRRQEQEGAGEGGGGRDGEEELFGGVRMESMVAEGVVRAGRAGVKRQGRGGSGDGSAGGRVA